MVKEIIGFDPAYINYAVVKLRFERLDYRRTENGILEEMPIFTVSHMEVWNLRDGKVIRNSEPDGGNAETYLLPRSMVHPTGIKEWLATLNHIIVRSPWIHETYSEKEGSTPVLPAVTIEIQCDHIKNGRLDMFRIGNGTETSIHMADLYHHGLAMTKLFTRQLGRSARKYGIKSNGSLEYVERKDASIGIVRTLFKALGLDNWLAYLDSVVRMGQKIDDLCDSLLLALHIAVEEFEVQQKKARKGPIDYTNIDNTIYPKLLVSSLSGVTEFEFNDDSDEDEVVTPTKKRKYTKKTKEVKKTGKVKKTKGPPKKKKKTSYK